MENSNSQKSKGILIRKMRNVAIVLYVVFVVLVITSLIIRAVNTGVVSAQPSLPFIILTIWFFTAVISNKKEKLDKQIYWYKNQWGWMILVLVISILISVVLPFLALTALNSVRNNNLTQNVTCDQYKNDINAMVNVFNAEQQIEERGDNDDSVSFCKEYKELKEIFYSNKVNSCVHLLIEQTLCQPSLSTPLRVAYEYQNLYNTLTGEELESFRPISRGDVFDDINDVQKKINEYKIL